MQQCGGADAPHLGDAMADVIDGIMVMLRRGEVTGGPSKLTVPVLGGNKFKEQMGLIERLLKRKIVARFLLDKFPMESDGQQALVQKYATFVEYDKHNPAPSGVGGVLA